MRLSLIFAAACILETLPTSVAQETITVQVIDITNGKPANHRAVYLDRLNQETHMPVSEPGLPLKGTTNEEGKVSFSAVRISGSRPPDPSEDYDENGTVIRESLSPVRDLDVIYGGGGIQCSFGEFSIAEVLRTGVVGDDRCSQKFDTAKFKPTPGEVIIFVRKYHWWEAGQS